MSQTDRSTLAFRQSSRAAIIVELDAPRWTILDANQAYVNATQHARDALVGHGTFEAFPQSEGTTQDGGETNVRTSFEQAVAERRRVLLPVQRYDLARDGAPGGFEEHYWELSSSPIVDEAGDVTAVLHEVENVTERVRSAAERQRLVEEVEARNRQLEETAIELEAQAEELQTTAAQLEERTEEAEAARHKAEVAERQLQTAFAQAPAAVAVTVGPEHRFVLVNRGYEQLVGRVVRPGQTFRDALPEITAQGYASHMDRVYRTGVAHSEHASHAWVNKDGAGPVEGWYDFVYQPLFDSAERVMGIMQLAVDVSAQHAARREIERLLSESRAARAEAEAANRGKSQFLAVMSHELRTPLNAISGYTDLIELGIRGPITEAQREDLGRIQKSQRHLLGLINDVLNYTRVEASAMRYEITDFSMDETLATCEALTAPQRGAKGLRFRYERCDPAIAAHADRERVEQIVLNVLTNAMKFTAPGGRIELSCSATDDEVRVVVADTGRGIPAELMERVFEPFVQVEAGLTRTQDGMGLGLAISREFARGMGGELRASSTEGVGSTFTLTLPRAR